MVEKTWEADGKRNSAATPHDEAFKKLLQTFFAEFLELFFPEVNALLDHSRTRLLMQELLVDIVGEEARTLDLLLETRYRASDAYILVHLEPQSYRQADFHERMFIYFSRLFERHRKQHKLIIPIAIFTSDEVRDEPDTFEMHIPDHEIVRFRFLKVELRKQEWRRFIDSDNPVAAALLAKMGYNEKEKRQVRFAYLRMLLSLRRKLDDARMALLMSVANLYFEPDRAEDEAMLLQLREQDPEGAGAVMEMAELVPMLKRWGYVEGVEKGWEEGREAGWQEGLQLGREAGRQEGMQLGREEGLHLGREEGLHLGREEGQQLGREEIIRKLLERGFITEEIAAALELPPEEVRKAKQSD